MMPVSPVTLLRRAIKTQPHPPRFHAADTADWEIAQFWMGAHLLMKRRAIGFTALPEYPEILDFR